MLTLITYPAGFQQFSYSPFCVKVAFLLNMSGFDWTREDSHDPRKAPQGKLPVLRTPEGLVHDSAAIQSYLERKGAEFDGHLSARDLACGQGVRRMLEDHLYFVLVLDRWEREEVWDVIRDRYFAEVPGILRKLVSGSIRRSTLRGLWAQGLGRMTWDERMERADHDLSALSQLLSASPFLFGQTPSSFDASAAAMLCAMRATPCETPLSQRVATDPVFSDYLGRATEAMG